MILNGLLDAEGVVSLISAHGSEAEHPVSWGKCAVVAFLPNSRVAVVSCGLIAALLSRRGATSRGGPGRIRSATGSSISRQACPRPGTGLQIPSCQPIP